MYMKVGQHVSMFTILIYIMVLFDITCNKLCQHKINCLPFLICKQFLINRQQFCHLFDHLNDMFQLRQFSCSLEIWNLVGRSIKDYRLEENSIRLSSECRLIHGIIWLNTLSISFISTLIHNLSECCQYQFIINMHVSFLIP